MISNESLAMSISIAILLCLVIVYGSLMSTLAEPAHTDVSATCTHGCPLQGSGRRRADELTECLYTDGQLVETRERLSERQYIKICEFEYSAGDVDTPSVRQYIVTY